MLGFVINWSLESQKPKYMQLYEHIRQEIHYRRIEEGEKLPSIRSVAESLAVSKSTVEMAYAQLMVEGYIEARPKSGYYVLKLEGLTWVSEELSHKDLEDEEVTLTDREDDFDLFKYGNEELDLAPMLYHTDGIEEELFNFTDWRKMMSKVLDYERAALVKYGNPQGEYALRVAISKFVHETRGVICKPEQIIVGAGVQPLFMLLATLLKGDQNQIAIEFPGFLKGATIFEDLGYETIKIPVKAQGINLEALKKSQAKIVYVSPAHQYPTGSIMPIGNRLKLLKWAQNRDAVIIEDDYDSVLRYEGMPIPALQGLNRKAKVVYVGAFSKLLMPSLRISFIILPENLLEKYVKIKTRYTQTVSKVEQLALAHFMSEGYFDRHIRKIKKAYSKKNQLMLTTLRHYGINRFDVIGKSSGLHVVLAFNPSVDVTKVAAEMKSLGIKLDDAGLFEGKKIGVLSYSGIADHKIDDAVRTICSTIDRHI